MISELKICCIQNLKECVVKLGVKDSTIYVLLKVKENMKVNIVFSVKAKTYILNVFVKVKLFSFLNSVPNQKQTRTASVRRISFIKKSSKRITITR